MVAVGLGGGTFSYHRAEAESCSLIGPTKIDIWLQ